jgi:hypothetical protein
MHMGKAAVGVQIQPVGQGEDQQAGDALRGG